MPDGKKRTEAADVIPLRKDGVLAPRAKKGVGLSIGFDAETAELIIVGADGPRRKPAKE